MDFNEIIISELEADVHEVSNEYNNVSCVLYRLQLHSFVSKYIKGYHIAYIQDMLIRLKEDFIPFSTKFMEFVLRNNNQLKRKLTIDEAILLNDKFEFMTFKYIVITSFKQLYEYKIT